MVLKFIGPEDGLIKYLLLSKQTHEMLQRQVLK